MEYVAGPGCIYHRDIFECRDFEVFVAVTAHHALCAQCEYYHFRTAFLHGFAVLFVVFVFEKAVIIMPGTHKNITVVDTTGAGDVFHGAFIFGLLKGWDAEKSAKFSSAVSAIKCTRLGGRAALPDYKTVQNFIKTGKIDYTEIDKRVEYYHNGMINSVLANCK